MLILVLGLALWWAAHLWKRVIPENRAQFGEPGKGIVTGLLILSVVLMVWGFRSVDGPVWWGPSGALKGINNLLVLAGIYLFAASGMKTGITRRIRHPQLTGFALWAVAHLLPNGDLPSFVLFGGLLVWALAEIVVINSREPGWTPPQPVPARKEAMAVVGTLVVFGVLALIHTWLGYNPLGA
ncbi:NnrU family protein [Paracoccus sp. (in: a-proteobacteria)]|uniref:NnrU family protein n=1 Tax=Paracoccus sp. TaxID=267 RepID=UPI003A851847